MDFLLYYWIVSLLAFSESGLLDFFFSQDSWSLHQLATDVPLITCLVNGVFHYIIGLYHYWLSRNLDCRIFSIVSCLSVCEFHRMSWF